MKGFIICISCIFQLLYGLEIEYSYNKVPRRHMSGFIVGGIEVPISMHPYIAVITRESRAHCGGVIISKRVVLSAAHCAIAPMGNYHPPDKFDIYLGSSRFMEGARYKVCQLSTHEKYSVESHLYDISTFLLTQNIIFGTLVQKAIIAPDESWKNTKYTMTVAGFGVTTTEGIGIGDTRTLRATRMRYVDAKTCNGSQYGVHRMIVPDHMFCMIGEGWTSDCFGDSGSAVIWKKYLVGLVATGRDASCGSDVMPSMYTNVVFLRDWIESRVKNLETSKQGGCRSRGKRRGRTNNYNMNNFSTDYYGD